MKTEYRIMYGFYLLGIILTCCALYATFFQGIEWAVFALMTTILTIGFRGECIWIKNEIRDSYLSQISSKIREDYLKRGSGERTIEIEVDDLLFEVTYEYQVEGHLEEGARFMGDTERLWVQDNEWCTVLSIDCFKNGVSHYTGLTTDDVEEYLL